MERAHRIFPNTLRMHRKAAGYTQRQVASLLSLHDTVPISAWEKGMTLPNTANLIKLCLLYRTLPNDLYSDLVSAFREELERKEFEQFSRT
ncbi:MAG: helix-turn-helix transcriptional regulator [Bacteroidetes bacterium]|nr:helix-turn-helix transcriptional regulator [Bacteroidota bacterium]